MLATSFIDELCIIIFNEPKYGTKWCLLDLNWTDVIRPKRVFEPTFFILNRFRTDWLILQKLGVVKGIRYGRFITNENKVKRIISFDRKIPNEMHIMKTIRDESQTCTFTDQAIFNEAPRGPGMVAFRKDTDRLYFRSNNHWREVVDERKVKNTPHMQ